jgi:hypothetical protein
MTFNIDDVTCLFTLKACAQLSVDAVCCIPCCCACGGCFGRYQPCIAESFPDQFEKKGGGNRSVETCFVQTVTGILMPFTCCGCLWACCGLATPCARCVIGCVVTQDEKNNAQSTIHLPPIPETMEK